MFDCWARVTAPVDRILGCGAVDFDETDEPILNVVLALEIIMKDSHFIERASFF
jgi:hypothetical protein